MLEQQCPAKVLRRKTKTDEVKCGLLSCSALNIPVVWQWRWWWWAKSNWLSQLPDRWFFPPMTLKDSDSLQTDKPPPLLPSSSSSFSQPECHLRLVWTYFHRETNRPQRIYSTVRQTCSREASFWRLSLYLSVCLSDWATTLPQLHSQRLQWEITFLVNLIFFLSGLTFH